MGSFFDSFRDNVFSHTTKTFGYPCEWTSTDGLVSFSGLVHFKNPTEEVQIQGVEYDSDDWIMEYNAVDFPGLLDRVEQVNNVPEKISLDGKTFTVKNAYKVHDGGTIRANLILSNNDTDA